MAFKLTPAEQKLFAEHIKGVTEAQEALQNTVEEAKAAIQKAASHYDDVTARANEFTDDVGSRLRGEFDDKSEKWQEGDKGIAANEMIEQWENVEFEPADDDSGEIEEDTLSTFADLPTESAE
jgi:hypothetical protein